MTDDATALLAIIAGRDTEGFYEFRCRDPHTGRIAAREWFRVHEHDECVRFIDAQSKRLDVYVGAALRTRRAGGKDAIRRGWCVWVDIDNVHAVGRLWSFAPRPSLTIRSGTSENVHAYWALSEPLSPVWLERANRRLAYRLGGDMRATDAARILRPPGSLNHKNDPPTRVTIAHEEPQAIPVSFLKNFPDPKVKPPARRVARLDAYADDPLLGVSSDRYYTVLTGRDLSYGNVTCPFPAHHGGRESKPSMRLYDGGTFNCFGCGVGGGIYQFASHLWEMDARTDFRRLRARLTDALGG